MQHEDMENAEARYRNGGDGAFIGRLPTPATPERTDQHRPSAIDPLAYEYVAQEYMKIGDFGDAIFMQEERKKIREHMARTGGTYSKHAHGGNCMVCGSPNAVYTVLFYHPQTNSYVRMGQDCAEKCHVGDPAAFRTFRTQVQDAMARQAGIAKAKAILAQAGLEAAYMVWNEAGRPKAEKWGPDRGVPYEERTIRDIVGKLVQYGSLSQKQLEFLRGLLDKLARRPELEAQRKAETDAAGPLPEGRQTVTGTVLSTKFQESDYGETLKMLFRLDNGSKVWCTVPSGFLDDAGENPVKGRRGELTVTMERSKDDPKFGFGKRPAGRLLKTENTLA